MSVENLFRHFGFQQHPFQTWIAEDERSIAEWFVEPPFLRSFLGYAPMGQTIKPASHLVFGSPGAGKTALRKIAEAELVKQMPAALVLRYVDFSKALATDRRPALSAHVEEILLLGTVGLFGFLYEKPERYADLAPSQKAELLGLAVYYYENLPPDLRQTYITRVAGLATQGWRIFREAYNTTISILKREKIEPAQWSVTNHGPGVPAQRLRRFWYLAHSVGVNTVWVMVDGVDEEPSVRTGSDIVDCVSELLLSQSTLEFRQDETQVICFKCFLSRPEEVLPELQAERYRKDRVKTETISWSRADLDRALQRRLAYFSNKKILSFDDLCTPDGKGTHDRLVDACELNPRTLFRMAHEIFTVFERRSKRGEYLLDAASIQAGIQAGQEAAVG